MFDQLHLQSNGQLVARLPNPKQRINVLICPSQLRAKVIESKHVGAHLGIHKTVARIRLNYYWPGITADVRRYVMGCTKCQQSKLHPQTETPGQYHLHAGRCWEIVAIDLVGPFMQTPRGNTQVLVITDHFSRWSDALCIRDGQASTVAQALDERVFAYMGCPEIIHSDQGRQFTSDLFSECCKIWGVEKTQTSPYRPQANSKVERGNRTLGSSLRARLIGHEQRDWDLLVPQIMRTIRASPHAMTGYTPNFLTYGREVRLPDQLYLPTSLTCPETIFEYTSAMQDRMRDAQSRLQRQQYQVRLEEMEEPPLFAQDDSVWMKNYQRKKGESAKLAPKLVGPYRIREVLPYHTYQIERGGKLSVQHESRLRLHIESTSDELPSIRNTSRRAQTSDRSLDAGTERRGLLYPPIGRPPPIKSTLGAERVHSEPGEVTPKTQETVRSQGLPTPRPTAGSDDTTPTTTPRSPRETPNIGPSTDTCPVESTTAAITTRGSSETVPVEDVLQEHSPMTEPGSRLRVEQPRRSTRNRRPTDRFGAWLA